MSRRIKRPALGAAARPVPEVASTGLTAASPGRSARMTAAATVSALIAGPALWIAMRGVERAAAPLLALAPDIVALAANAGIEEGLRLTFALAAALWLSGKGLPASLASLGVLSSCVLAALENASYVAAFPTLDAYWRLGYSVPIHACAAALYALVSRPSGEPPKPRASLVVAAFAAAWAWHTLFNITAALWSFPALPLVGTALNLAALAALSIATALGNGYRSIYGNR